MTPVRWTVPFLDFCISSQVYLRLALILAFHMTAPPEVLDILFPKVRSQLLRLLFSDRRKQRYVRELMSMSGLALRTVQVELTKLSGIGVVTSWSNGYHRFYRANRDHPLFRYLSQIVRTNTRLARTKNLSRTLSQRSTDNRPVWR
jgi:predicted transcriptional regulator